MMFLNKTEKFVITMVSVALSLLLISLAILLLAVAFR